MALDSPQPNPYIHRTYASHNSLPITTDPTTTRSESSRSICPGTNMATSSNIANGRPSLPSRHTHHGCGPSTNQMLSSSYEGYLFVPSEHHSREDKWTFAQPIKISVSQGDLLNEVIKQQRSGKTALEEFCGPRVDDAKRGMINNLIKERTITEPGATYTLAAIKIDRDYVSDEEPDFSKVSLRDHQSKDKELKKRMEEASSVLIILQGSVIHCPDHVPADFSQTCNPDSANAVGSLSPAAEKLVAWTAPCTPTSSTPLRYVPFLYNNIGSNANGSDQSLTRQQVYQQSDDTPAICSERSSSVTSFDTSSSSSLFTPTSATSNNDSFIAVDHGRNHNGPQVPPRPSAYELSGISMSTESTTEKALDENAQKQQPLRMQHPPTQATEPARPYTFISSSAQTNISVTDFCEAGPHVTLGILKCSTGEMGRSSTADHGQEIQSMTSCPTSEDRTMSTGNLTDCGDSPLHPRLPRAQSSDVLERKPSWMDNMVPVIPPPAKVKPIASGLEEISAESSVTEDYNPKRSNEKDTEHQNVTKCYQPEHQENSYQHPRCDDSLAVLPMPAREDIQASAYNAEAKGRTPLRPHYTEKLEYTDSLIKTSAKEPANKARYTPPTLAKIRSYEKLRPTGQHYDDVKHGATGPEESHVSTSHFVSPLGKPRSYERLRPEHPPTTSASQPTGIRKIYRIKTYNEPDKAPQKHVKFSTPLASSSSLDPPSGSNISCPDPPPYSPRTTIASDLTEPPRSTSQATSRPPLHRQSSYVPVHCSDTRGSHHSSSKNNSSKQPTSSTSREVKFYDRKHDKENDRYNSCRSDNGSDGEQKTTKDEQWSCPYKHCDRHREHPYATYEEAKEHLHTAHKRDRTGRYLLL